MSDSIKKINDVDLEKVSGGVSELGSGSAAKKITPKWVEVTATTLNIREYPNGPIIGSYSKGDKILVDRMSKDGLWYGFENYLPTGGKSVGYVSAQYVRDCADPTNGAVG